MIYSENFLENGEYGLSGKNVRENILLFFENLLGLHRDL